MKNRLKEITDLTINEVLKDDIIMPSSYFKCFSQKAKNLEIDLEENNLQNETDILLASEFKSIDTYLQSTLTCINSLEQINTKTQKAINNMDKSSLNSLNEKLSKLQKELDFMKKEIYIDPLTQTYNKKWLHNTLLNKNQKMRNNGTFILIHIKDFEYILKEHNSLVANNLVSYIIKFIKNKLEDENMQYQLCKYFQNTFLLHLDENRFEEFDILFYNLKELIKQNTLKSKSGFAIKPRFTFESAKFKKNEDFFILFEELYKKLI